eukprot:m.22562 g.22562  ORF g.22562 m.22562 type:complete len:68 (+) comp5834_c0_seq1:1055-1258(+)
MPPTAPASPSASDGRTDASSTNGVDSTLIVLHFRLSQRRLRPISDSLSDPRHTKNPNPRKTRAAGLD